MIVTSLPYKITSLHLDCGSGELWLSGYGLLTRIAWPVEMGKPQPSQPSAQEDFPFEGLSTVKAMQSIEEFVICLGNHGELFAVNKKDKVGMFSYF